MVVVETGLELDASSGRDTSERSDVDVQRARPECEDVDEVLVGPRLDVKASLEAACPRRTDSLPRAGQYIFIRRVRRNRPDQAEQYRRRSLDLARQLSRLGG
jgi:hypothetical protein